MRLAVPGQGRPQEHGLPLVKRGHTRSLQKPHKRNKCTAENGSQGGQGGRWDGPIHQHPIGVEVGWQRWRLPSFSQAMAPSPTPSWVGLVPSPLWPCGRKRPHPLHCYHQNASSHQSLGTSCQTQPII
ncbi:hypothetical protein AVEN_89525-1 [Araneus ventricosus]|uniref:Uncharacterized protein n=1 Tax=Araneus ventricosus TaxID=182803 RepID=A0A4Y2KKI8_ARAVE|nr:hypothetical protein AVEN_89525-1 [Araneus ventricosus]